MAGRKKKIDTTEVKEAIDEIAASNPELFAGLQTTILALVASEESDDDDLSLIHI